MKGDSLLWTPFRLRGIELRNRFVMLAHWNGLEAPDGTPTEDLAAYYAARAKGGVGLITTGSQAIHPSGKMAPGYGRAWGPRRAPGLPAARRCGPSSRRTHLRPAQPWRAHQPRTPAAGALGAVPDARALRALQHRRDGAGGDRGGRRGVCNLGGKHARSGLRRGRDQGRPRRPPAQLRLALLQPPGGRLRRLLREAHAPPPGGARGDAGRGRPRLAHLGPPLPARVHLIRLRPRLRSRGRPGARGKRARRSLLLRRGNLQQLLDGDPAGGGAAARLQRPERRPQARDPVAGDRLRPDQESGGCGAHPPAGRCGPHRHGATAHGGPGVRQQGPRRPPTRSAALHRQQFLPAPGRAAATGPLRGEPCGRPRTSARRPDACRDTPSRGGGRRRGRPG